MEDPEYLQPGFDPATLKVAGLRGILLEHNVDFPSSAKKAQLVELFTQNIAPKARRILSARSRVKASDRGIVNVNRDRTPPVEAILRRRSSRRKGTVETKEGDEEGDEEGEEYGDDDKRGSESVVIQRRSASVRRASGKHNRVPETDKSEFEDQEPPKSIRRTRKSVSRQSVIPKPESPGLPPLQLKSEDTDGEADETVFSSHNFFQSGSSPATKLPDISDRRKTMQSLPGEKRRKSLSSRRRTDFPVPRRENERDSPYTPTDTHVVPSSKKFEIPLSRLQGHQNNGNFNVVIKKEKEEEDDYSLEPGEEFTPEGTEEVARQAGLVRRRRGGQSAASTNMLWVIVVAILSAYFMWWRKEKMEVGYCGYGKLDMQINDPDWTSLIRPQCEPCPPNAICKPNYEAECKDDYVLIPNPLTFGGLIPLPPTCEADSEKLRRIAILSDEAIRVLRERAADVECGEVSLGKDEEAGVSEADLRQVLYDLKAPSLSDTQFSELWRNALEDVSNREEVVYNKDSHDVTYLQSTSLTGIPLGCAIRKSITGSMARYRIELIGIIFLIGTLASLRASVASNRTYQTTVTKLVHISLQHLARTATENPKEPWIGTVQLRDQVLQHEFNSERRRKLWEGVQKIVEMNSNVRAGEREISGEMMRVWTWIGGGVSTARLRDVGDVNDAVKEEEGSRMWVEYPKVIV